MEKISPNSYQHNVDSQLNISTIMKVSASHPTPPMPSKAPYSSDVEAKLQCSSALEDKTGEKSPRLSPPRLSPPRLDRYELRSHQSETLHISKSDIMSNLPPSVDGTEFSLKPQSNIDDLTILEIMNIDRTVAENRDMVDEKTQAENKDIEEIEDRVRDVVSLIEKLNFPDTVLDDEADPKGQSNGKDSKVVMETTIMTSGSIKTGKTAYMEMKCLDPNFAPVDVCRGQRYVYGTSQVTGNVAAFENGIFKGVLKLKAGHLYRTRNVLCAKLPSYKMNLMTVFVLDECGIHVFDEETGHHLRTFLSGSGMKYRGIDVFNCYKNSKDSEPKTYLVTMDVHKVKKAGGVSVVVFTERSDDCNQLEEVKRFPVESTSGLSQDPKCRFISVRNDCSLDGNCIHEAYFTGMSSQAIYKVDLNTGNNSALTLMNNPESLSDLTFVDPETTALSGLFFMVEPTGIHVNEEGNLMVADRLSKKINIFKTNGTFIESIILPCSIIGFDLDTASNELLVADNAGKRILCYRL